jgi:hypothetical protein
MVFGSEAVDRRRVRFEEMKNIADDLKKNPLNFGRL